MPSTASLTTVGVYLSQSVYEELDALVYERAGVLDLETYFDANTTQVPPDDPGGEVTAELLSAIVDQFRSLYTDAEFDAARSIDADTFVLVQLAASPTTVTAARERFEAASVIQETDLRTVQTAIFDAYLDRIDEPTTPIDH